jgi:hypothetical protein
MNLAKGELMEEQLRSFFLEAGYYVIRGAKYKYEGQDVTDVDLFLYARPSGSIRHRMNVDIKNKRSPQAFERILWANGLKQLLGFDSCMVATTDKKKNVMEFARKHDTTILDGEFLAKIKSITNTDRIFEEDLTNELAKHKSYKTFGNKDWRRIYEESKSRLLTELDYSGLNSMLATLKYFLEKVLVDEQKRNLAIRMSYILSSHILIALDYILKDISFYNIKERELQLSNGLKFGNLGADGADKLLSIISQISGSKAVTQFYKSLDTIQDDVFREFFSRNENANNLFQWAKKFERLGFSKTVSVPDDIDSHLKGVLAIFIDYYGIERKRFFNVFESNAQISLNIVDDGTDNKAG